MNQPIVVLRTEHGDCELGGVQEATLFLLKCLGGSIAQALPLEHMPVVEKLVPLFDEIIKRGFAEKIDARFCACAIAIVAISSTEGCLRLFDQLGIQVKVEAVPITRRRVDPSAN